MLAEDVLEAEQSRAEAYMAEVQQSAQLAGMKTETRVTIGTAAATIQDIASEDHCDIIVMSSHGDTGFKRWVLGSVAQKVSRHSPVPVLVLHEDGRTPESIFPDPLRPLRSIMALVALDGSTFAEAAIEPAANLVAALAAPAQGILLFTSIVSLPAEQAPDANEKTLDDTQAYLEQVAQRYAGMAEQLNLLIYTSIASGKDVADALVRAAEEGEEVDGKRLTGNADLIAMATHGRSALQHLFMGSVTERVLGSTKLPLLIVHAQ
jgi:nucleotide-binding universal stress UspA family protein